MTAREILMSTKRLFTSGHWTEGAMHTRVLRDGELTDVYCLVGGLRHSTPGKYGVSGEYVRACRALVKALGFTDVTPYEYDNRDALENLLVAYNDGFANGQSEKVVALIDKAVAGLDKQPAA